MAERYLATRRYRGDERWLERWVSRLPPESTILDVGARLFSDPARAHPDP